jgi:hypothetical protein
MLSPERSKGLVYIVLARVILFVGKVANILCKLVDLQQVVNHPFHFIISRKGGEFIYEYTLFIK